MLGSRKWHEKFAPAAARSETGAGEHVDLSLRSRVGEHNGSPQERPSEGIVAVGKYCAAPAALNGKRSLFMTIRLQSSINFARARIIENFEYKTVVASSMAVIWRIIRAP